MLRYYLKELLKGYEKYSTFVSFFFFVKIIILENVHIQDASVFNETLSTHMTSGEILFEIISLARFNGPQ